MHSARFVLILLTSLIFCMPSFATADELPEEKITQAVVELEKIIVHSLKETGVPGLSIAIVHKDRVIYLKGFGVKETGKDEAVDADTVFQLASVSKPLTSSIMAAMVGEGLFHWDDAIIKHDAGFQLYDPWVTREVTIRDMLSHRSGLSDHAGDLLEDMGYNRTEVLRRLRFEKPVGRFRRDYAYTNFGYTEAALAGAKTTGKSWEDIAHEKLFTPLGMNSSSFRYSDFNSRKNRALLHVRQDRKWVVKHIRQPDAQSPAGGASSSAREMAQWVRMLVNQGKYEGKQIIATAALYDTFQPQMVVRQPKDATLDRAGFYGLGWNVSYDSNGRITLGHSGGFDLGAATVVTILPSEHLGIVVLTNGKPIGLPESISTSFFDLALRGKLERDWLTLFQQVFAEIMKPNYGLAVDYSKPQPDKKGPLALTAYAGKYDNDFYGTIEVKVKGQELVLEMGPDKTPYSVSHWNRDTFTYQPTGENAGGLSSVSFLFGPDGRAERVIIENLNTHGLGTFISNSEKKLNYQLAKIPASQSRAIYAACVVLLHSDFSTLTVQLKYVVRYSLRPLSIFIGLRKSLLGSGRQGCLYSFERLTMFSKNNDKKVHSKSQQRLRLELERLEDRMVPAGIVAVGAESRNPPLVQVFDAETHALKYSFLAFNSSFRGGVNVAVGDVNGDGTPDIVAAAGPGHTPHVKVYDGLTGNTLDGPLGSFLAFSSSFRGGVQVATGDVNGDGYADVITGAGKGGSPRVTVYSGADGTVLTSFLAFESTFKGGVRVAAGDFRQRHATDIVVSSGPGRSPLVRVFAGDTQAVLSQYQPFRSHYTLGVHIGTGDINKDGTIDVITGSTRLGKGLVKVFSGASSTVLREIAVEKHLYIGTIHVDAIDGNGDGDEDILVGLNSNRGPIMRVYSGFSGSLTQQYSVLDRKFAGGASVAGSVPRGRGTNYQLSEQVTNEIPVLERLGQYVPIDSDHPAGQYISATAGSITGNKNVYFISHGWAPGYRDWVNLYANTHVLKWWETAGYNSAAYPPPKGTNPGPDSAWMFLGYSKNGIPISPTGGLAQQIHDADPNAIVFAYSWIDDSATTAALNNAIPEQAYLSEALTNINGVRLATAVSEVLGAGFSGNIHLMGHSHGSKVATLAAVALKQAGVHQVQQLTIFDSPESEETDEINASNFLWNYLPQLVLSKQPHTGTFVDNYFSAFGINYATMKVDGQTSMQELIDVQLFAYPYSRVYQTSPGDWHAYPPAWYAQAHAQPSSQGVNGGLKWSPILGYDPSQLAAEWEQAWTNSNKNALNQAELTNPWFTITPGVTTEALTINDASTSQPVTTIELGLGAGESSTFKGTYSKNSSWSGIAFDYVFSGEPAILKIQINDYLAYYVDSRYVPAGITQHVTMNIGWPSTSQKITATLISPNGAISNQKVTMSNFRQFDVSYL